MPARVRRTCALVACRVLTSAPALWFAGVHDPHFAEPSEPSRDSARPLAARPLTARPFAFQSARSLAARSLAALVAAAPITTLNRGWLQAARAVLVPRSLVRSLNCSRVRSSSARRSPTARRLARRLFVCVMRSPVSIQPEDGELKLYI